MDKNLKDLIDKLGGSQGQVATARQMQIEAQAEAMRQRQEIEELKRAYEQQIKQQQAMANQNNYGPNRRRITNKKQEIKNSRP